MLRRRFLCVCAACSTAPALSRPARASRPSPRRALDAETLRTNLAALHAVRERGSAHAWRWIVVHHTATSQASVAGIDAYHRQRFDDALGAEYHFLINNGRKGPDGAIEAARWRHDQPAAHLFHPERVPGSLAVCLVGNFETLGPPSGAQMEALAMLVRELQLLFEIPDRAVTTHRGVDGRLTQCPGRYFSLPDLLRRL